MLSDSKPKNAYRMLVVRDECVFYLTMDPATGEMELTGQLVGAAQFHPAAELAGSKVRQRIEYRAKQQGLLQSDEKRLMKPENSILITRSIRNQE